MAELAVADVVGNVPGRVSVPCGQTVTHLTELSSVATVVVVVVCIERRHVNGSSVGVVRWRAAYLSRIIFVCDVVNLW